MTQWQPIETAPKGGRGILLYVPENRCIYGAYWSSHFKRHVPGWCVFGGGYRVHLQRASHWMPVPDPPKDPTP